MKPRERTPALHSQNAAAGPGHSAAHEDAKRGAETRLVPFNVGEKPGGKVATARAEDRDPQRSTPTRSAIQPDATRDEHPWTKASRQDCDNPLSRTPNLEKSDNMIRQRRKNVKVERIQVQPPGCPPCVPLILRRFLPPRIAAVSSASPRSPLLRSRRPAYPSLANSLGWLCWGLSRVCKRTACPKAYDVEGGPQARIVRRGGPALSVGPRGGGPASTCRVHGSRVYWLGRHIERIIGSRQRPLIAERCL